MSQLEESGMEGLVQKAIEFGYDAVVSKLNERAFVRVSYKGPVSVDKDHLIRILAQEQGLRWYGQGYCFETRIRDLCFTPRESSEMLC